MNRTLVSSGIKPLAHALRQGSLTIPQLVESCLDAIRTKDDELQAWVTVDEEGALRQGQEFQKELQEGRDRGLLHGMPFGIKDIVDVEGMATIAGAPWRAEEVAGSDAAVVGSLRNAGAVILGKTATTQFALYDPCETKNPLFPHLTPVRS